jgi:hypothetical protein
VLVAKLADGKVEEGTKQYAFVSRYQRL